MAQDETNPGPPFRFGMALVLFASLGCRPATPPEQEPPTATAPPDASDSPAGDTVVTLEFRDHVVVIRAGERFDVRQAGSNAFLAKGLDRAAFARQFPRLHEDYVKTTANLDASL